MSLKEELKESLPNMPIDLVKIVNEMAPAESKITIYDWLKHPRGAFYIPINDDYLYIPDFTNTFLQPNRAEFHILKYSNQKLNHVATIKEFNNCYHFYEKEQKAIVSDVNGLYLYDLQKKVTIREYNYEGSHNFYNLHKDTSKSICADSKSIYVIDNAEIQIFDIDTGEKNIRKATSFLNEIRINNKYGLITRDQYSKFQIGNKIYNPELYAKYWSVHNGKLYAADKRYISVWEISNEKKNITYDLGDIKPKFVSSKKNEWLKTFEMDIVNIVQNKALIKFVDKYGVHGVKGERYYFLFDMDTKEFFQKIDMTQLHQINKASGRFSDSCRSASNHKNFILITDKCNRWTSTYQNIIILINF